MTDKDFKRIIQRIVDIHQEQLNDWEIEFISSVYQWHVLDGKGLSKRQAEIVLKINRKMIEG